MSVMISRWWWPGAAILAGVLGCGRLATTGSADAHAEKAGAHAEKGEEEAKKQRDSNLKRWLSQVSPAATNATLTWTEESKPDGSKETVIRSASEMVWKTVRSS